MKEKEESQGRRKLKGKEEDQVRDGVIRGEGEKKEHRMKGEQNEEGGSSQEGRTKRGKRKCVKRNININGKEDPEREEK